MFQKKGCLGLLGLKRRKSDSLWASLYARYFYYKNTEVGSI